jgi:hypothetical protein
LVFVKCRWDNGAHAEPLVQVLALPLALVLPWAPEPKPLYDFFLFYQACS